MRATAAAHVKGQPEKNDRPRTANSAAVILALLALVAGTCIVTRAFATSSESLTACITDADGNAYALPLDEDATLSIVSSEGRNVVKVKSGTVRMEEADCPNQDCVHQGEASAAGQQIVCLPHKLVVSVTADSDDASKADSATAGEAAANQTGDAGSEAGTGNLADGAQTYDIIGS